MEDKGLVDVWLPIKLGKSFTYRMPSTHLGAVYLGHRVVVPFGGGVTVGVIWSLSQRNDTQGIKRVLQIPDGYALWDEMGRSFITWLSSYYLLPVGEVIQKAIGVFRWAFQVDVRMKQGLTYGKEGGVAVACYRLLEQGEKINGKRLGTVLKGKNWVADLRNLVTAGVITLVPSLALRRATAQHVARCDAEVSAVPQFSSAQQRFAMACYKDLVTTQKDGLWVALQRLVALGASVTSIKTLVKKGVFQMEKRPIAVSPSIDKVSAWQPSLAPAHEEVLECWNMHQVVLVTGKRIATSWHWGWKLIFSPSAREEQGCCLMPFLWEKSWEKRLKKRFGEALAFYHSRLTPKQKQAIWHGVRNGSIRWVVGTPGVLFLPFKRLKRLVIAEEHAYGYQNEATTWGFQVRDAAIMLAHLHQAKVVMTTPLPSLESYYNVGQNKYGSVRLPPVKVNPDKIRVILPQGKNVHAMVWPPLVVDKMKRALAESRQIILIHHRAGYAGYHTCGDCQWLARCKNCHVPLRIEENGARLVCNYCGSGGPPEPRCPNCAGVKLHQGDFGTQQLEELIKILFPKRHVACLTGATADRRYKQIWGHFMEGRFDFLVATQGIIRYIPPAGNYLIVIPNIDGWWKTPHFRAEACVYRWLGQLTAGGELDKGNEIWLVTRKKKRGRAQDLVVSLLGKDELQHCTPLLSERASYHYPPYVRLLKIVLSHKNPSSLHQAAKTLQSRLTPLLDTPPLGPSPLRNLHQKPQLSISIKMPLGKTKKIKTIVSEAIKAFQASKTGNKVRLALIVDSFL
ncbi:MAG: hypothetical protein ACPGC9_02215 [Cytophagales bacterium]